MEKIIYLLWHTQLTEQQQTLTQHLLQQGAQQLRLNIADADVAPGSSLRITGIVPSLPDGVLSFWLPSSGERHTIEQWLLQHCQQVYGYSVCESEPLRNTRHPITPGDRTEGMNQVVFLQRPAHLAQQQWLDLWLNQHTEVAIRTQQTFGYRQNIVVWRFDDSAPVIDAIIEENFPLAALTDSRAFYATDRPGEPNMPQQMLDSCRRFIDFKKMARLPTSEYNY